MEILPRILATWSFGQRGLRAAWPSLEARGSSLDAVERACMTVEEDSDVDSVGYGGLPDAEGEVSLDASVMVSPGRSGSVSYVRRYVSVTSLARRVMERTSHRMLAGEGAERFAASEGFTERALLAPDAERAWRMWRDDPARTAPDQSRDSGLASVDTARALRPVDQRGSGKLFDHSHRGRPRSTPTPDDESRWTHRHDTIGTLALDAQGVLAGACSTSGVAYKLPGRVGDSPIIGHGLYVDPSIGAVTATGTGELIMDVCGSFLIVELIRQGMATVDAIRTAIERVVQVGPLHPKDQVAFIVLRPDGSFASGALRGGFRMALRTPTDDTIVEPDITLRDD